MRICQMASVLACTCISAAVIGASPAPASPPQAKMVGSRAVAPKSAPRSVKTMIKAANHIRHRPYRWGGGHVRWNSRGYDCSGSVSYVMRAGGLLGHPLDSSGFMRWGKHGAGSWVRIYASKVHVFAVIAGLRWDTSYITDGDRSGPGWSEYRRPAKGFWLRHPQGVAQARPLR